MLALLRLVSLRHLFGSPLRTSLTVLGVAVGVATLVGITAINRSVMGAFRSTIDTIAGKAELSISRGTAGFDDAQLAAIKATPGVTHAAAMLNVVAPVKGMRGERLYVMGVDLLDDGYFRTYEGVDRNISSLADDLEFLNSTDRMLVSERFAASHGLKTGDSFALNTPEGEQTFIIHGLLKESGPIKAFGGSVGVMFLGSAQEAFGKSHLVDRIDIAVAKGVDQDELKSRLEKQLGPGYEIDRPSRRGQSVEKMVRSFQLGLNLGSGVALLVGVFLVYNTVAIGVVQRRREIGTLRALGATRRRIRALFALEAVVLGAFGAAVGLPLGAALARAAVGWVSQTISTLYIQVNAKDVSVTSVELMLGIGMGIFGSAFAALRPAVVASSVQPVEALRRDIVAGADAASLRSWPTVIGIVLLGAMYPATLIAPPVENLPIGGYLSMFCALMAATLLCPLILRGLQSVYQRPGELALGIAGRLAADNFARTPARTAVPVSALAIGVAMTVCIAGFVGSFQKSSQKWVEQAVPADLFLSSSSKITGIQNQPMTATLGDEVAQIPGVKAVDKLRFFTHDVLGLRVFIISLTPEIYEAHGHPDIREGTLPTAEQRQQGFVTISENLSRRRQLHPGDSFDVDTPTGRRTYRVAAVITDYTSDQGAIFMERRLFIEQYQDALVDTFEIYLTDLKLLEEVRRTITDRYAQKHDLYVLSNSELRAEAQALISNAFSITYAMELVAVVLALLGVINTLLAAVLDRTREIGLLRAIGAARSHIVRLFAGEATLIGLTGGAIGVAVGAVLGYVITKVVGVQGTGWEFPFYFPWQIALQMLGASTVFAVLAGLYPARRAAKLDVVEALAYE